MKNCYLLLLFVFTALLGNAQTAIQTSFETTETPAYTAAVLPQNGWTTTTGNGAVYTTLAHTGTQSLNITSTAAIPTINKVYATATQAGLQNEVYLDMWLNIATISGTGSGFVVDGYDLIASSEKRLFEIDFRGNGKIFINSSSTYDVGSWTANTWFRLSVKMDISAEKYQVAINGILRGTSATTPVTEFPIRETYSVTTIGPTGSHSVNKEYHSLRLKTGAAINSNIAIDDVYTGTTAISDVSFGTSSTSRTVTVTQPAYGTISLNPAGGTYALGSNVTVTLTVPTGYKNNGWTGNLSGTTYSEVLTVDANKTIGADVIIDASNPPPKYVVTVNQPANGTITLSPAATNNEYYSETSVTATLATSACYQFAGWTGDLAGNNTTPRTFVVQSAKTIGATITPNTTPAQVRVASTVSTFKSALAAMNPGDTVILENGSYALNGATINRSGCESRPIVIMARTSGGVTFTGGGTIVLESVKYITFKGFKIQTTDPGTGIKMLNSSYNRITENTFKINETTSCNWLYIGDTFGSTDPLKSGHNVVDHNIFDGKTAPGKFIVFDGNIDTQSQYDTVRYNHFKNNGPRVDNEKESIRVGVTTLTRSSGFTVIEHNLFEDCDGDPEIVSLKSCDNIVRYNTFRRCLGTVCIRQSFRSTVEGNFFFGEGKTALFTSSGGSTSTVGCGGVRVYGLDHKIINNYFTGLTGNRFDAAITITNGDDNNYPGAANSHHVPENLVVANNTLVNNYANIEIGFNNSGSYPSKPINCLIADNLIVENTNPIVNIYTAASRSGITFSNNMMYPTGTATVGMTYNASEVTIANPLLVQPLCADQGSVSCNQTNAYSAMRLSATSPAINAATGNFAYVTTDNEGQVRGTLKDIGADEYLADNNTVYNGPLDSIQVGPSAIPYVYSYSFSGTLPVRLLDFKAAYTNKVVTIKWNVSNQVNVKSYLVQWSKNGRDFQTINVVNATAATSYGMQHNGTVAGKNYYRLQLVDNDGSFTYSGIQTINTSDAIQVNIYPNPAQSFINIDFGTTQNINTNIKLINASGIVIKNVNAGRTSLYKLNTANLSAGVYHIQVIQDKNIINKTINIIK